MKVLEVLPMSSVAPHLANSANKGVVVTAFPDASNAGALVLQRGGNAIDAACAAAWALSVCEPAESGLGGQTTMLIRFADGRQIVVDGHSRAPQGLRRRMLKRREQKHSIKAAVIPSMVATLAHAQRKYGKLQPSEVIEPAIAIANEGYAITKLQQRALRWTAPRWKKDSAEAQLFLGPGGGLWEVGEVFRQPTLAKTLERLSKHGAEDFYTGEIAREIVQHMVSREGLITQSDLATLALPIERTPLSIECFGHRISSVPPPGGGVQVLLALSVLEALRSKGLDSDWTGDIAEALLAVFRERERWPDHPKDFNPTMAQWLVGKERAKRIADAIIERRSKEQKPDNTIPTAGTSSESGNTTHLCATDRHGNVVSLTQSIQSVFGSKVAHPTLGFIYNNYLCTCPRKKHPYRLKGGCLPQSNAAPTIVSKSDGQPVLALGSAGSRRIASSVVQVIANVICRGESLQAALHAPRFHPVLSGKVWAEKQVPEPSMARLATHCGPVRKLSRYSYKLGAVQAIAWDANGVPSGHADPRRDGASVSA